MLKDLQQKVEFHQIVSLFECRNCCNISSVDSNIECFSNLWWNKFVNMDRGICVANNAMSPMSSMNWWLLFWCNICWSKFLPLFAVSDSPSCNLDKKWSSLEAVKRFKVEDRFPSKSVRWNLMREFQKRSMETTPLLWLFKSRLDGRMWWPYFSHWKESPHTYIGIGMLVFIVNKLCSSSWVNCVTSNPFAS